LTATAGDEDIGAETSSIDPNDTAEPVHWERNEKEKVKKG
jgi:hypothetical protein